jgi:hypothetical protein
MGVKEVVDYNYYWLINKYRTGNLLEFELHHRFGGELLLITKVDFDAIL